MVEDQIFPNLQTGFSDENAYIRELTLKATLAVAPKMKQATLTGGPRGGWVGFVSGLCLSGGDLLAALGAGVFG